MSKSFTFSRRIALASVVSLTAIACSPINANGNLQDASALQEVDEDKMVDKRGVRIVKRGGRDHDVDVRVMMLDNEGGKPHKIKIIKKSIDGKVKIDVEGGELVKDDEGRDVVVYTDDAGKEHRFNIDEEHNNTFAFRSHGGKSKVWVQDGETHIARAPRAPREPRAPRAHMMRIEMENANNAIEKAREELEVSLAEVEKELSDIKDKDSAEFEGLKIAQSAIKSAMSSLGDRHFDEKEMRIEIRKMDKMVLRQLKRAMKDVHEQREIIVDLQVDLQDEVKEARQEMREMIIEIETSSDGEDHSIRLKAIEEMEEAMGGMAELRLKALKKAEEELRKSRLELEKQIEEQKAKALEEEKANPKPSEKEKE